MKGKLLFLVFATFFAVLVIFSTNTLAAESLSKDFEMDSLKEQSLQEIKKEYPDAQFIDLTLEEYEQLQKQYINTIHSNESIGTMSSASPVTNIYFQTVSSNNGTENVRYKTSTNPVKGYTTVGAYVVGYGNTKAWLGNEQITLTHRDYTWNTSGVDFNGDYVIDAFYHTISFNSDAKIFSGSSKQFKIESRSYNYPFNTMSATLNIVHE